jgi:hypothetical protein
MADNLVIAPPVRRCIYVVLSARALPYARIALRSLFQNSLQALDLTLITDSEPDSNALYQAVKELNPSVRHSWKVVGEGEITDRETSLFGARKNLRAFRRGHPCWRKITDPLLLSEPGKEMVLLDPDLYFPNRFQFEETPAVGLLLMWQQPNCLLPPEVVWAAIKNGIPLAWHVDIGVAHWRALADLDWLDWLLGKLGGAGMPRIMHVEAIVWAAIAMHGGGGYLDPSYWRCWRRTPFKRALARFGTPGKRILRSEPWSSLKCFHAGGEAKWWLNDVLEKGIPGEPSEHTQPGRVTPFVELQPSYYAREQAFKKVLRKMGYYKIFDAN